MAQVQEQAVQVRFEEFARLVERASAVARAERSRVEELVERLERAARDKCLWLVARAVGERIGKSHGEYYRIVLSDGVEVLLDTWNGYLSFNHNTMPVTTGYDASTFKMHVDGWHTSIEELEAVVRAVEQLPDNLCKLAEIAIDLKRWNMHPHYEDAARILRQLLTTKEVIEK